MFIGFPGEDAKHACALLSLLCGFPGTIAQAAASCIAQCAEKCKELKRIEKKRMKEELTKGREGQSIKEMYLLSA